MVQVAYLGGAWATNIGNSFYNLGILHLLKSVYGESNVYHTPNLAGWFWDSPNCYDVVADVDVDLVVLSGPCFSRELDMYRPLFERIRAREGKVAFISVGAGNYSSDERQFVADLLNEYMDSVAFVSTRDRNTYELYKDLSCPVLDGICGSMFLDEAVNVPSLERSPYIVLNIDARFEPELRWIGGEVSIEMVQPPLTNRSLAQRAVARARRLRAQPKDWPTSVGPYQIVRTQSGVFSRDAAGVFDRPQTHYAVIPEGYLAIYKSAELVITNRVHTTAATLVLGGTARYLTTHARASDGRWALLDRVGAGGVRDRATSLDRSLLEAGKHDLTKFLRDHSDFTARQ